METFEVNVQGSILKPIETVFDAIINPNHITNYFASKVSGEWIEGNTLELNFEDFGVRCEVRVLKRVENQKIHFEWNAIGGTASEVNITLEAIHDKHTNIQISESSFQLSQNDVQKAIEQTQGWTDFICCLKAYLYTGINLRNGKMKGSI
ncbi:MAG: SRPBCC domain-containing protein [Bacteroidales bacterium]|nr:SRPBCC domain-containing protein [Bacteroidales bacterium]